jgi:hypothetical protein
MELPFQVSGLQARRGKRRVALVSSLNGQWGSDIIGTRRCEAGTSAPALTTDVLEHIRWLISSNHVRRLLSREMHNSIEQPWCASHRADPAAARLADRHYNRQKIGSPQFAPTGSCAVFVTLCGRAFWITSAPFAEWVKHAWAGAWVCSAFRSEGAGVASDLIKTAVAASLAHYGDAPPLGMVSFIDRRKVRPIMVRGEPTWGWTWRKAGFVYAGETKGGLMVMQLHPCDMPLPLQAHPRSMHGTSLWDSTV